MALVSHVTPTLLEKGIIGQPPFIVGRCALENNWSPVECAGLLPVECADNLLVECAGLSSVECSDLHSIGPGINEQHSVPK